MRESWDRRIGRAEQLAREGSAAESLLAFYVRLLRAQKHLYDSFKSQPSGSLQRDLALVRGAASPLLRDVARHGPDELAAEARGLLDSPDRAIDDVLLAHWCAPTDRHFFAKSILQPYGQYLADAGVAADRPLARAGNRCPRCGGAPQLSILEPAGSAAAEGSSRQLLCANCLTAWPFPRVMCPHCGGEDERQLGYFQSPAYEHLRVEACEACRHYLKGVHLGRLGLAVPLVDEVAGAPLDLWASERGYQKIELNLVGL